MKKLYLFLVIFCLTLSVNAQFLNWGIKGGVNYNENGDLGTINAGNPVILSANEEVGYHFGILSEIKLPLFLYIRPELIYTHTESSYELDDDNKSTLKLDKLELPVLVGFRVFKIGRFFFGPNFSYIMNTKLSVPESVESVSTINSDDFLVSGQVGLGLNLGKIGADIRWETGFTDSQASFIRDSTNLDFALVDTSHSQFILSFYYKFK